jgi:hypothetical protein
VSTLTLRLLLSCALVWIGCTGTIGETLLDPATYTPEVAEAQQALAATAGFADERGGGVFLDVEGRVVRLRLDGSLARIESHPGNSQAPGRALRVFAAGPFSALVVAEAGLYLAEGGWLIEPSWRDQLDAGGIVAVALGSNGVTWVAHQRGLFRIEAGQLSELKVAGTSLLGISALAAAAAPDGGPAVWFAQGDRLLYARQLARTSYEVREHARAEQTFGAPIRALAGLSAAPGQAGELWVAGNDAMYQQVGSGWARHAAPSAPTALVAAGRYLWLHAGTQLYRYDADARGWSVVAGLPAPAALLLCAEAGGSAWLRAGERTFVISPGPLPRLVGLFDGMRVYTPDVLVTAQFPSQRVPTSVTFSVDESSAFQVERTREESEEGEGAVTTHDFVWGGRDGAGTPRAQSIAGLADGLHTLTVTAKFPDRELSRLVHFEFRGGSAMTVSFARDVSPIAVERCAKCHTTGPGRALTTYEQWLSDKSKITAAVVEQRMPADGPLDPSQIEIIQRWAAGMAAP